MAFAPPFLPVTSVVKDMKSRYLIDRSSKAVVLVCATACFVILLAIVVFTLREALPAFRQVGLLDFLFGKEWSPGNKEFGILPIIVGSVVVTAGALIIAVPLGIACAILLAEVAPSRVRQFLRPTVELLVGIPSVVYGLVGMVLIVPLIRQIGGSGYSVAAGVIVLTGMVLPTIISISEDSIRAVPKSYKEGALALGATQWQTIWRVLLPAARSGIMASIILAMGRAIGEAMAMIMVLGNAAVIPTSLLGPARTLAGSIAVEVNYASGVHQSALFATAVVLFLMVIIVNSMALVVLRRGGRVQNVG
jgi:phosphate transport system permease protein